MKRIFTMIVVLFLAASMYAQDAKVIALDRCDATKAARLYQAMKDAEKAWEEFQSEIKTKYLTIGTQPVTCPANVWCSGTPARYRDGFDFGAFKFSDDFKYIVPEPKSGTATWAPCGVTCNIQLTPYNGCCGGSYITPAITTTTTGSISLPVTSLTQ